MRPTSKELLIGIKEAMETLIIPDLKSPWPVATANSICTLLNHLALRVENEGQYLAEANQDMCQTFAAISAAARSAKEVELPDGVRQALRALEAASGTKSSNGVYVPVESLTAESNELRRLLIAFIDSLQGSDSEVALVGQMREQALACSKRLVERELLLMPPMPAPAAKPTILASKE